jgi:hypothetical protein
LGLRPSDASDFLTLRVGVDAPENRAPKSERTIRVRAVQGKVQAVLWRRDD